MRRRRECLRCGRRFTTYEYVESRPLQVLKRDGTSEPYERRKLLRSFRLPCAKRPVSPSEIEAMVEEIEDELGRTGKEEVESRIIGEMVMERLRKKDYVAYVRFASVYRNFQDLDEFAAELADLKARRARQALSEDQAELPL